MGNDNQSYFADQYFSSVLNCNRKYSFTNFHKPYNECNNALNDIRAISDLKDDTSRLDFMNSVYALLLSYSNYIKANSNRCNTTESIINCLKEASDATIIKPYLTKVVLPKNFQDETNVRVFDDKCEGYNKKYTFFQIKKNQDNEIG